MPQPPPADGLHRLLAAFAAGERTPAEVAEVVARRVAALEPAANVLLRCDLERLRAAAARSGERWAAGSARPLEGVPVIVKDNVAVDGFPTTAGGRAGVGIPVRQATVVDRLVDAGAIPFAKAHMTEYALRAHGRNFWFGDVPAPGAPGYLAGGSSSGSAAAVRLGLAPFALGSDTAGSVRTPAACCGVVGYKPAHGEVPLDGVVPLAPTCDHLGVLAAHVADLDVVLPVLGVPAPAAGTLPVVAAPERLLGPLDPGVRAALWRASEVLGASEGTLGFLEAGGLEASARAYEGIRGWEAFQVYGAAVRERPGDFGPETADILRGYATVTEDAYRGGLAARERLADLLRADLAGRALLLLPTLRVPAPPAGADEVVVEGQRLPLHMAFIAFVVAFSLVGFPAIAVPAGRLPGGLVASVQLVAAPGDEGPLLEAARRLESVMGTLAEPI